jgi:UDP-glucose-4-epimerase GalE
VAEVILVTGGAGYIGSHALLALREAGYGVVAFDDLSEGHEAALLGAPLVRGSLLDAQALAQAFGAWHVAAVMHFAARCYVGESVHDPGRYYRANFGGTLALLDAMVEHGVRRIVFSSTCAVYGEPARMPIDEDMPLQPVQPYGASKLFCERALADYGGAHGIDAVALRYFNAAGADPQGRIGEDHEPETHLVPLVIQAALHRVPELVVHGADYPTADGTCVRDYVHVSDLAQAHVLALQSLERGRRGFSAFNLGNEAGASVLDVIRGAERVGGRKVPYRIGPRRPGDPPTLVGSARRAVEQLGWQPRHGTLDRILQTAWQWHERHPHGFLDR